MTPPLDLAAIRARVAAATPGPWRYHDDYEEIRSDCGVSGVDMDGRTPTFDPDLRVDFLGERRPADAAFIAAARADVPALCDALDAARTECARYAEREAHFARVLAVADGGTYRADWDGAIRRVLADRDAARATIAAQAAEVERLRGEAARAWSASADAQCEAARAYSIAAEMLAHPPDVAAARDDARALAADALRYGLEECERLRAHLCAAVSWGYLPCDQTVMCPCCGAAWWDCPEGLHENWHAEGCEFFAAEVASGRSVDVRRGPAPPMASANYHSRVPPRNDRERFATVVMERDRAEGFLAGERQTRENVSKRLDAACADRDALRVEVAGLRAVVEGRGSKGDET